MPEQKSYDLRENEVARVSQLKQQISIRNHDIEVLQRNLALLERNYEVEKREMIKLVDLYQTEIIAIQRDVDGKKIVIEPKPSVVEAPKVELRVNGKKRPKKTKEEIEAARKLLEEIKTEGD
jgi:hypothetical protein